MGIGSFILFIVIVLLSFCERSKTNNVKPEVTPQSCLDYLEKGHRSNGFYTIYDFKMKEFIRVYCDMSSEPGAAWTLVESFAFKYKGVRQFTANPFKVNSPVNKNTPNWNLYRMSWSQMSHLKSQSTHWRATCSFPVYRVDYTDYARGTFTDFDIMTFQGLSECKKVEFINIRGNTCAHCTSQWWGDYSVHIDSSATKCQFKTQGALRSEDNFGLYRVTNKKFRCTSGANSTTNWWFGAYL